MEALGQQRKETWHFGTTSQARDKTPSEPKKPEPKKLESSRNTVFMRRFRLENAIVSLEKPHYKLDGSTSTKAMTSMRSSDRGWLPKKLKETSERTCSRPRPH